MSIFSFSIKFFANFIESCAHFTLSSGINNLNLNFVKRELFKTLYFLIISFSSLEEPLFRNLYKNFGINILGSLNLTLKILVSSGILDESSLYLYVG